MKLSQFRRIIKEEVRRVINESFSDVDSYKAAVDVLKTLHGLSGKIQFRVQDVNGYYNIVYDDPQEVTKDLLTKLKDRKLWNTEFAPTTGKFANGKVNITFQKPAQEILNIIDFDKKIWSPKQSQ